VTPRAPALGPSRPPGHPELPAVAAARPARLGSLTGSRGRAFFAAAAFLLAAAVAAPIAVVVASLAAPARDVWVHLLRTQMVELAVNTVVLLLGVGAGVLVVGVGLAWLVATHRFPGRDVFEWALILPLAVPTYVIGFVVLGLLDFAGPLQVALREVLGPDFRLPEVRSGGGVIVVMTLVLYPYVYTLARAAFLEQGPDTLEAARSLGCTGLRAFVRVTLPMARPSIASGVALACMEALADFGTVAIFGYRTFTEAIYRVWHGMFDRLAATQLAVVLLGFAALLLALERRSRGQARYVQVARHAWPLAPVPLDGWRAAAAIGVCVGVLLPAFALPIGQLILWAWRVVATQGVPREFAGQLGHSLWLATVTAAAAGAMAVVLAYAARLERNPAVSVAARFAAMGYALPGSVIASGVLLATGWLDQLLGAALPPGAGLKTRMILTGSAAGLVYAYLVRVLAVGFQTVDAALLAIPVSLDEAARSLGAGTARTLARVHLPLLWRGMGAALALVFVDVMKEMPATVLLRPFGLDTLAIGVWQRTSESLWEEAAVPALAIVVAGLVPVALTIRVLSRASRGSLAKPR
jgi:iron(III) transport system permease protein